MGAACRHGTQPVGLPLRSTSSVTALLACSGDALAHQAAVRAQATSVRLLVEREMAAETSRVFCYQAQDRAAGKGFLLGLTSEFLLGAAAEHGHGRAVLVDATHGMNSLNVRLRRQHPLQWEALK